MRSFLIVLFFVSPMFGDEISDTAHRTSARIWRDFIVRITPDVPDAPKPGDKCAPCKGTGQVGDGRVFSECLSCNGTGIVPALQVKMDPQVIERIDALEDGLQTLTDSVDSAFKEINKAFQATLDSEPPKEPEKEPVSDTSSQGKPNPNVLRNTIIMISIPGCVHCDRWEAEELPAYVDKNWDYDRQKYDQNKHPKIAQFPFFIVYDNNGNSATVPNYMSKTDFNNLVFKADK